MTFGVIDGPGADVTEPAWEEFIPIRRDRAHLRLRERAHEEWTRIADELRANQTMAAQNARTMLRLVLAYLRYDLAAVQVMKAGAVTLSKKSKVPMLSIWQVEMRQADNDATVLEMELCLTPRRRGAATKALKRTKRATAADSYLKRPAAGG